MNRKSLPIERIIFNNSQPVNAQGQFVLYWMTSARRLRNNFALDHAVWWAKECKVPLLIFEPLRCNYPWACDRLHQFVIDGMREHAEALQGSPVGYYPYVEPSAGAGKGLLLALAALSSVVVADYFPAFFLPRMQRVAREKIGTRFEVVDTNGILPLSVAPNSFSTAHAFRRFLQKNLRDHLLVVPHKSPLQRLRLPGAKVPADIIKRWPAFESRGLSVGMEDLPIDHRVAPTGLMGGQKAARRRLKVFVQHQADRYGERNQPEEKATSGLSPYLHFGQISAHEILAEVLSWYDWVPTDLSERIDGSRMGWWGLSEPVESFLDQLVTWRELGFVYCHFNSDYEQYDSLPGWAKQTLADHAGDPRPHVYSLKQFEASETHDPIWNAAQNQLVRDGIIHNYLRMLWGKKILDWSASPQEALAVMIHLNDKYALDGRDPNSYSGIFWCLGRFDRAWGPERPIFGKVRYMSSDNTARKLRLKGYLSRYGVR